MKLRELFDKLTPGMLDCDVKVKILTIFDAHHGPGPLCVTFRPLEKVEIEDDGSVTLVVTE